jgi:hypothetical protein
MSGKVKRGYNHSSDKAVALKIIDKQTTPRRVLQVRVRLCRVRLGLIDRRMDGLID